jgi:hypothetical protein
VLIERGSEGARERGSEGARERGSEGNITRPAAALSSSEIMAGKVTGCREMSTGKMKFFYREIMEFMES